MDLYFLKITISILICTDLMCWTYGMPLRRESRSSNVDWANYYSYAPQGRGTYAFGYDVEDPETNNIQFRDEERHPNGTVTGSYGYLRPDGLVHIVHYVADDKGYRVSVENDERGQLKPYPDSIFQPQASSVSPAMASALQSREVYKKQKVHEQRIRPIERSKQNLQVAVPPFFSNSYEEQLNTADNSDFHETFEFENNFFNDFSYYDTPYKFYVNGK